MRTMRPGPFCAFICATALRTRAKALSRFTASGVSPARIGHLVDGHLIRRNAMIHHQSVEPSIMLYGRSDESLRRLGLIQFRRNRKAVVRAALAHQSFSLAARLAITEGHARARLGK